MSGFSRQSRRRCLRAAGKHRQQEEEAEARANRSLLEAVDERASDLKSPAAKLDPSEPAVLSRLRRYLRSTGVVAVLEDLLRSHPGRRSPMEVEALLLGMLMANWQRCSHLRTDLVSRLLSLPPQLKAELGLVTDTGRLGLKYRTGHKQISRLEAVLRDQTAQGGPHSMRWLEKQMIEASVPHHIRSTVDSVTVDETAFKSWQVPRCVLKQEVAEQRVRAEYRGRFGDTAAVPEMSSPTMRIVAAEIGIPLGADGRIIRTFADPDARGGYKTPTGKDPSDMFTGYTTVTVTVCRTHTLSRNSDKATFGDPVRSYVLDVTTRPANNNPGPVGLEVMQQARRIAPGIGHVYTDQGFSNKAAAFTVPLRRESVEVHMNLPEGSADRHKVHRFPQRGGTHETVIEHCGTFCHQFMPIELLKAPYAMRRPWQWTASNHYDDGSIRFICPFQAGTVHNRRLESFRHRRPASQPVTIPDDADRCCNGSFVVAAEDLARYQTPDYGSEAHATLLGLRNPAEGVFGNAKTRGGLLAESCKAKNLEPHALAALCTYVVRNLQLTMNDEIADLKAARQAKQQRKHRAAERNDHQKPMDGSEPAAHTTHDTNATTQQPADDPTDDPGNGPETASRAPP